MWFVTMVVPDVGDGKITSQVPFGVERIDLGLERIGKVQAQVGIGRFLGNELPNRGPESTLGS